MSFALTWRRCDTREGQEHRGIHSRPFLRSRRTKVRTTNGCWADTPSNASCIAWAGRHIGTNLPSREPHSLRCGRATLTGPQKIWIYSDKDHPLSAMSNKQSEESARFRKKTALYSTAPVEGTKIKEDDEYDGVRVKLQADLAGARIPMQIDTGLVMPCTRNPN